MDRSTPWGPLGERAERASGIVSEVGECEPWREGVTLILIEDRSTPRGTFQWGCGGGLPSCLYQSAG